MNARRAVIDVVCRRLPSDIATAAAGDIEEVWRREVARSRIVAVVHLTRELTVLWWCARRIERGDRRAVVLHEERRVHVLSILRLDARFAIRLLIRDPRTAVLSIGTLAIGLAATTALFALTNAWLLRPLPFRAARDLVAVWETVPSQDVFENTPAPAVLYDWRARSHAFAGLGAMTTGTANLTGAGDPEQLSAIRADAELLHVLNLEPAIGRVFPDSEDVPAEVLLTDGFWRRRFGGSRDVVGTTLTLDGAPAAIVGVLAPGTALLGIDADVWVPLRFNAAERGSLSRYLWVVGRLRPGVSVDQASADVDAIARSREPGLGARAVSLQEQTVGSLGHDLPVLFGATAVLLLIACANVASLTLARAASRRREFALRAALGASRWRLARQVVVEAVPAGLMGGAAGLLLSSWIVRAFTAWLPQRDTLSAVQLSDPRVAAFGLAASLAASIVFAVGPALQSASRRTIAALREGSRGQTVSQAPLRVLASLEIGLAVALLVAAALVGRSFLRLSHADLGFQPAGVVTFELPRPSHAAAGADAAFFDQLLGRLAESPAVRGAGLSQALPLKSFGFGSNFPVDGLPAGSPNHPAMWRIVSPQYFDTLGIPLKSGRAFDAHDRDGSPLVAIVSESYAKAAWPDGTSPIGRRIGWATLAHPMTVVGVASDVHLSAASGPAPHVYMPFTQVDQFVPTQLAVRARGSDAQAIDVVRRAVWSIDPLQPVANIQPMSALAWRQLGRRRFQLALWTSFAVSAAVLALLGVYGVVSYTVRRSSKEIGIRLALGARPSAVVAQVVRQGLWMAAAGASVGVLIAVLDG